MTRKEPKRAPVTYAILMAAARDAGNRHARQAGRDAWNEADWNHMAAEFERLRLATRMDTPLLAAIT